jgi:hypothetical protein
MTYRLTRIVVYDEGSDTVIDVKTTKRPLPTQVSY